LTMVGERDPRPYERRSSLRKRQEKGGFCGGDPKKSRRVREE